MVAAPGCATVRVVVDLCVQRICGDDPGGGAPAFESVGRLHALLDLFSGTFLVVPSHALHCVTKREETQEVK